MIPTGLQQLDKFLSGGIPPSVVVDIYGGNATGKTLLILQLAVNSIKNGGKVLYVDTTGGFRPERVMAIQKASGINFDVLGKITVSRVTNTFEQINSLKNLKCGDFSLIAIDNITDLFSYEYTARESIMEKNALFMKYMHELSQIAIANRIPVVVTNMIRNIKGQEAENMKGAVDPFTHIKIHLYKNQSKYNGRIYWALNEEYFEYKISDTGIHASNNDELC